VVSFLASFFSGLLGLVEALFTIQPVRSGWDNDSSGERRKKRDEAIWRAKHGTDWDKLKGNRD